MECFLYRYRYAVPVCYGKQGSKYTTALETSKYDQQAVIRTYWGWQGCSPKSRPTCENALVGWRAVSCWNKLTLIIVWSRCRYYLMTASHSYTIFFLWLCCPTWAMASSFLRFLDHTQDPLQTVGLLCMSDLLVA